MTGMAKGMIFKLKNVFNLKKRENEIEVSSWSTRKAIEGEEEKAKAYF